VHLYGEWILLNTIPSYLGLSDVGFGSVAGNEMTMLAAAQDFDQALVVFQSVWVLTTVITSLLGLLLIAAVWLLPLGTWLHMHAISPADARLIVLLLGLAVLLGMQETLFQAAFRCVGKYPLGTMAKSLVVLAAFLSTMIGVGCTCLRSRSPCCMLRSMRWACWRCGFCSGAKCPGFVSAFGTRNGRSFAASPARRFPL
jgi:hypothetical protein